MAAALVLGLVVIAVVTRTTNWDSLTYHLPRVIHCMQQGSVDHLGTNNMRQIEFGPWSEYAILNLHLLSGGDRYDNLVQWFAMTGSVAVGSFMAQRLGDATLEAVPGATGGATRRSRNSHRIAALSTLLGATLPIPIIESITTQNDYVVAAWLTGLVCLLIELYQTPSNFWYAAGAAMSLALGLLTKATMFIYAALRASPACYGGSSNCMIADCGPGWRLYSRSPYWRSTPLVCDPDWPCQRACQRNKRVSTEDAARELHPAEARCCPSVKTSPATRSIPMATRHSSA